MSGVARCVPWAGSVKSTTPNVITRSVSRSGKSVGRLSTSASPMAPRFDGPALFCRLPDGRKGGWFHLSPAGRDVT